jgi:hypothetical protein
VGWERLELKDVYVGTGDISSMDFILQVEVHDEYFAPASGRITLTEEQVDKLEREIKKWRSIRSKHGHPHVMVGDYDCELCGEGVQYYAHIDPD